MKGERDMCVKRERDMCEARERGESKREFIRDQRKRDQKNANL